MGVLHQLGLVLAVQLTPGRQDSASPLPCVLQRKGRAAEFGLKPNIAAVDSYNVANLGEKPAVAYFLFSHSSIVSMDPTCLTTWGTPETWSLMTSLVASLRSPPTVLIALQVYSPWSE